MTNLLERFRQRKKVLAHEPDPQIITDNKRAAPPPPLTSISFETAPAAGDELQTFLATVLSNKGLINPKGVVVVPVQVPTDSATLSRVFRKHFRTHSGSLFPSSGDVACALRWLSGRSCISIRDSHGTVLVEAIDPLKLRRYEGRTQSPPRKNRRVQPNPPPPPPTGPARPVVHKLPSNASKSDVVQEILTMPTIREKEVRDSGSELLDLVNKPTAREELTTQTFRHRQGSRVRQFCQHGTRAECTRKTRVYCHKVHFRQIILPHTDVLLGDCSYLDTCRHMETCRFVHYALESTDGTSAQADPHAVGAVTSIALKSTPPQWISCDIRSFDMSIFNGRVAVVMADPPWDIHMELPYGTMADDEMRALRVDAIQDDGLLFLWVTGRALELGRECMKLWGYRRIEEIIWVKTNQLQRIIRTGRTGHWLNHSKEHCLVGIKGSPNINKGIDCDVIVADVRETSRKPDEVYRIIERMSPGTLKVELFGRQHNVRNNWITLGNQLDGTKLEDGDLLAAHERYIQECGTVHLESA